MYRRYPLLKLAQEQYAPTAPPQQFNLPDMSKAYAYGGGAAGAIGGGAIGAALGNLVADQSHRNIFNIRIPGSQRIEDNEGRLVGGAIGALLGGLGGASSGVDMAQQKRFEHTMELQRMQDRAEVLRKLRNGGQ